MSNFHVGQKVVCIDAVNSSWRRKKFLGLIPYITWFSELVEGQVYTVSSVFIGSDMHGKGAGVGLKLAEVVDYPNSGFRASRFRPVVERKTSIECFRSMLNKPTVRVDA